VSDVEKQLDRARSFLASIPGAADTAISRALNRAAAAGRESAISAMSDRYAAQPSDVREKVTITTSRPENLEAAVVARSGPLALGYFPHAPTTAGTGGTGRPILRAEVLRGQVKNVPGAFIAPINGKPRIMIRSGRTTSTGRAAIHSLYTVPIASMLGAESVREAVGARAFDVLEQTLDREIDRALGKSA
jgi:hypothetical protein